MRTTLNIDADVLKAAQAKALYEDISVGKALSEMVRQGATAAPTVSRQRKSRLPRFILRGTPASVQEAQEHDDD